jgi:hypothetical protein
VHKPAQTAGWLANISTNLSARTPIFFTQDGEISGPFVGVYDVYGAV